jgi:hypothetical protein
MTFAEAKNALWLALGNGSLHATAISSDSTVRRPIPSYRWPELDVTTSWGEWVITGYGVNNEHPKYLNEAFDPGAVIAIWPPRHDSVSAVPKGIRDGDRGPLSWMYLVKAEHRARVKRGEAAASIRKESKELSEWFQKEYPGLPPLAPKTIANELYRLPLDPDS